MPKTKKGDSLSLDKTAAIIFTLVAILHAWRLLYQIEVRLGLFTVPLSWSLIAILVSGMMALAFWRRVKQG